MRVAAVLAAVAAVLALAAVGDARLHNGECEVCIKVVDRFLADAKEAGITDATKMEDSIVKSCKKIKHPKEKRMCYYIGGSPDSATRMLKEVARPMSYNMPADKICEKLKKRDHAICELTYPKEIDLDKIDLKAQRVKVLRGILSDWGEQCKGCTDKADYIRRIEAVRDQHAPKRDL